MHAQTKYFGQLFTMLTVRTRNLVPNLSSTLSYIPGYSASGRSKHEIIYRQADNSLQLPAVAVGRIAKIWFTIPSNASAHDILDICRSQAPPNVPNDTYPLGSCMLDAYLCSLTVGRYYEAVPRAWYRSLQELRDIFQCDDHSEDMMAQIQALFSHTMGRSVFSDTDGLLGICPSLGKLGTKYTLLPEFRQLSFSPIFRANPTAIQSRANAICMVS